MILVLMILSTIATFAQDDIALTRAELSTLLRSGEPVVGRLLTLEVEYGGKQIDKAGRAHLLFMSRDEHTLYLCFLMEGSPQLSTRKRQTITKRIVRVELQEQNLRDHRIYALWLEQNQKM